MYIIVSWYLLGIITSQGFFFSCSCMNRCTCRNVIQSKFHDMETKYGGVTHHNSAMCFSCNVSFVRFVGYYIIVTRHPQHAVSYNFTVSLEVNAQLCPLSSLPLYFSRLTWQYIRTALTELTFATFLFRKYQLTCTNLYPGINEHVNVRVLYVFCPVTKCNYYS